MKPLSKEEVEWAKHLVSRRDGLAPARGAAWGTLFGAILWGLILWAIYRFLYPSRTAEPPYSQCSLR